MIVHWGMLLWTFFLGFLQPDESNPLTNKHAQPSRAKWGYAIALMLPVIFFASVRGGMMDTGTYIHIFKTIPMDMELFEPWLSLRKGSFLYYGAEYYFKNFISDDPTMWLSLVALIQGFCIIKIFQKYSDNMAMSVYVFIGSTMYTWMMNGARQFLVVTILFVMTDCIIKNRWYIYLPILIMLCGLDPLMEAVGQPAPPWYLGGVHQSAYLMIPVFFLVQGKRFNWKMLVFVAVFCLLLMSGGLDFLLESTAETTEYSVDIQNMEQDEGASPFRVIVAAVPLVMAFMKKKEIDEMGDDVPPVINVSINMSVVTVALYTASVFTSGVYVGRLPVYTEIYNLILIPWLILNPYKKDSQLLTYAVYGAYLLWFVYQMYVGWGGLMYISDVLGWHFW